MPESVASDQVIGRISMLPGAGTQDIPALMNSVHHTDKREIQEILTAAA